jgi:AcrR family transcriptional regulator
MPQCRHDRADTLIGPTGAEVPPAPEPTLRERKRAAAKARVAAVAIALFAERGYAEVSVDEICAAADVAPRSFFRYFPAKEEVLLEPVREMSGRFLSGISAAPDGLDDDAVLAFALHGVAEHVLEHWDRLAVFFRVAAETEAFRASPAGQLGRSERELADRLLQRRPDPSPGAWRTRLRVGRAVAGFRVWLEDVRTSDVADPLGHLDEVLGAR